MPRNYKNFMLNSAKHVGIFTFMNRKNNISGLSEPEKMLNFLIFSYLRAFKISCLTELSTQKFYNLGAMNECLRKNCSFGLPFMN